MNCKINYKRLRELRKEKGISQTEISKMLCVSQRTYSNYEIGSHKLNYALLTNLSVIHNTNIDYLLGRTDEKKPYPRSRKKSLKTQYLRIINNLSQRDICNNLLHCTQGCFSRHENDVNEFPPEQLILLADFFHTSVDYLIGETNKKAPYPASTK